MNNASKLYTAPFTIPNKPNLLNIKVNQQIGRSILQNKQTNNENKRWNKQTKRCKKQTNKVNKNGKQTNTIYKYFYAPSIYLIATDTDDIYIFPFKVKIPPDLDVALYLLKFVLSLG